MNNLNSQNQIEDSFEIEDEGYEEVVDQILEEYKVALEKLGE